MLHIFDFDGTLADTDAYWNDLADVCLDKMGIAKILHQKEELYPMSLAQSAAYFEDLYHISAADFRKILKEELALRYKNAEPIGKYLSMAKELAEKGEKCCVATAGIAELAREVLKRFGAESYFLFITDADEIGCAKGDAAFFKKVMAKTGDNEARVYDSAYTGGFMDILQN